MSIYEEARREFSRYPVVVQWVNAMENLQAAGLPETAAPLQLISLGSRDEARVRRALRSTDFKKNAGLMVLTIGRGLPANCERAVSEFMEKNRGKDLGSLPDPHMKDLFAALTLGILISKGAQDPETSSLVGKLMSL
jgi:hypothetical protein